MFCSTINKLIEKRSNKKKNFCQRIESTIMMNEFTTGSIHANEFESIYNWHLSHNNFDILKYLKGKKRRQIKEIVFNTGWLFSRSTPHCQLIYICILFPSRKCLIYGFDLLTGEADIICHIHCYQFPRYRMWLIHHRMPLIVFKLPLTEC